jgi:hypothetical protein
VWPEALIDWGSQLEGYETHEERVSGLSPSASGNYIHSFLEQEFGDVPGLSFEVQVDTGRVDLLTDDYVYEFKTKDTYNMDKAPLQDDVDQVRRYLNSPDVEHDQAVLTYINRDEFSDVRQIVYEPRYDTDFVTDGGLPDYSDFDLYEVDLEK